MRGVISVALVYLILRKVNWSALTSVLVQLNAGWAVVASSCTLLLIATLAFRWRIFLRQQQIAPPFKTILSLTWAGQFFNSVLPGSTGGDLVKIYQICRVAPDRKAAAASTVFIDRLSALVALAVLAAVALLRDPRPLAFVQSTGLSLRGAVLLAVVAMLLGALVTVMTFRLTRGMNLHGRVMRTLAAARKNLVLNDDLVLAVVLSFGIHLLNFAIVYLFARSLQMSINYSQVLQMMPVVLLLMLLPITINGHGLRELLLISYFGYFGVVVTGQSENAIRETAVALSLVCVANDLLWSLPGGLLYLTAFRRRDAVAVTARPSAL